MGVELQVLWVELQAVGMEPAAVGADQSLLSVSSSTARRSPQQQLPVSLCLVCALYFFPPLPLQLVLGVLPCASHLS